MSTTTQIWRPSSARRVVLDGFAPVPRGTSQSSPPPLVWPAKDPSDVLDYEFDITAALVGNENDAIASVEVTASPDGAGHLAIGPVSADGPVAVLWIAGGQSNTTYVLQITITTTNGRTLGRAVALPVLALASAAVPSGALTTGGGLTITDQNGNPILLGS